MSRREEQFPLALSAVISIVIIIIIVSIMIISTNKITPAYVSDDSLNDGWHELIGKREVITGFLNLDQSVSYTYGIFDDLFPATLFVQTKKSIVLPSESQLLEQSISWFLTDFHLDFTMDDEPYLMGMRMLNNGHQTLYVLYNATKNNISISEEITIIIEIWNCGVSKTSIITIGIAQLSNHTTSSTDLNLSHWETIVSDPMGTFSEDFKDENGLIYSIICH